ncbi:MAG: hypothetical protein NTX25_17535 [Proteobacteria bacterium]|nr:hypothetical protein [Pseudomonadota bacterium]
MKRACSLITAAVLACSAGSAFASESFKKIVDVSWSISQPSSSSQAERLQAALNACTATVADKIDKANDVLRDEGLTVSFRNVAVNRIYGVRSETKTNPLTGVRHHDAWGLAECSYYQIVE